MRCVSIFFAWFFRGLYTTNINDSYIQTANNPKRILFSKLIVDYGGMSSRLCKEWREITHTNTHDTCIGTERKSNRYHTVNDRSQYYRRGDTDVKESKKKIDNKQNNKFFFAQNHQSTDHVFLLFSILSNRHNMINPVFLWHSTPWRWIEL